MRRWTAEQTRFADGGQVGQRAGPGGLSAMAKAAARTGKCAMMTTLSGPPAAGILVIREAAGGSESFSGHAAGRASGGDGAERPGGLAPGRPGNRLGAVTVPG